MTSKAMSILDSLILQLLPDLGCSSQDDGSSHTNTHPFRSIVMTGSTSYDGLYIGYNHRVIVSWSTSSSLPYRRHHRRLYLIPMARASDKFLTVVTFFAFACLPVPSSLLSSSSSSSQSPSLLSPDVHCSSSIIIAVTAISTVRCVVVERCACILAVSVSVVSPTPIRVSICVFMLL